MTIKNCEEECKHYEGIPYDSGVLMYCSKFNQELDDELIKKCDSMLEKKSKKGSYFVK